MSDTSEQRPEGRNGDTVRDFLKFLEEKDIDSWIGLWDDERAEQFYPYGTEMFPPHVVGKQVIHDRWKTMPDMFAELSFPIRELWSDGDTVIARFDGDMVRNDGGRYRNSYLGIFKFSAEGKLREYWEYFDPILAGISFGLAEVTYPRP